MGQVVLLLFETLQEQDNMTAESGVCVCVCMCVCVCVCYFQSLNFAP